MTPLVRLLPDIDPLRACRAFGGGTLFLDSARVDPRLGRCSYLFADPFARLAVEQGEVRLDGEVVDADPFDLLSERLARWRTPPAPDVPAPPGAAAGCFAYDLARRIERVPSPPNPSDFPELWLGFYDVVVCWDHVTHRTWLVSTGLPETDARARRRRAEARLDEFQARLKDAPELFPLDDETPATLLFDQAQEDYERRVRQVVEHVLAGDIFQANLSQRICAIVGRSSFDVFRRLHRDNAAPFAAWLDLGDDRQVVSASPERFLRVDGRHVETRPIKGTRPRGATPAEDEALAQELLASAKDRAENVMIVDLMRNDLSRVCRPHSVRVPEICALESYATVHHLVSTVVAELQDDVDLVDLLRATFPGGSITGAPKIRAMEILAGLELVCRGPYCGSLGYLGFDGRMDTSIAIRTMMLDGINATLHAGGGITAASDPTEEWRETLDKARGLIRALGEVDDDAVFLVPPKGAGA